MRIVPLNPTLKSAVRKCSTKRGRSLPFRGNQRTAWPFRPAMEVNVPHSWAVRLESAEFWRAGGLLPKGPEKARQVREALRTQTLKSRERTARVAMENLPAR